MKENHSTVDRENHVSQEEEEVASVIENKQRNEDEQVALEVAEASREQAWKSKSFIASIFLGELDLSLADPFPEQDPEDRKIGDEICAKINRVGY